MRNSVFDIEMRVDISREFENVKNILFEKDSLYYQGCWFSLYRFLDDEVFPVWEYKGLFMDFEDFLDKLNIDLGSNYCSKNNFLSLLEVLINLWPLALSTLDSKYKNHFSKRVVGYMRLSIPSIIEKMNYKVIEEQRKYIIVKRDSDVDSVLDIVTTECSKLLLDYNDIRNNTLKEKKSILKDLDLYIEKDKKTYKEIDNDTYNTIQDIMNNMGINHPINKEPYNAMKTNELIAWYDKCFKLVIHLIREKEIKKINKERKMLEQN